MLPISPTWHTSIKVFTLTVLLVAGFFGNVLAQNTPRPSIKLFVADKALEPGASVAVNQLSSLHLKVIPDSAFAAAHPNDVNYVAYWKMYVRSGSKLGQAWVGSGEGLPPGAMMNMKSGDGISVEIERVTRTDATGKTQNARVVGDVKFLTVAVK